LTPAEFQLLFFDAFVPEAATTFQPNRI
jgi:hypothetical protein